jgi:hypothetical protein
MIIEVGSGYIAPCCVLDGVADIPHLRDTFADCLMDADKVGHCLNGDSESTRLFFNGSDDELVKQVTGRQYGAYGYGSSGVAVERVFFPDGLNDVLGVAYGVRLPMFVDVILSLLCELVSSIKYCLFDFI